MGEHDGEEQACEMLIEGEPGILLAALVFTAPSAGRTRP